MKISLIALDLDGTLLTTDKRLTEHTRRTLARAAGRGIHIVPATGRGVTGLAREVRDLPFVRYAITVNGAAVWDLERETVIARRGFSTGQAEEIWKFLSKYHTMTDACIDGTARMDPGYYGNIDLYMPDEPRRRLIRTTRKPTEDMDAWIADPRNCVEKFNIFFEKEREEDRILARQELKRFDYLSVTTSLGNNLEINHREATKGNGLKALADFLNIPLEGTMAVGDGENDISMLEKSGVGVAMENADISVKKSADLVTLSNDRDGVAWAIEKYVLE